MFLYATSLIDTFRDYWKGKFSEIGISSFTQFCLPNSASTDQTSSLASYGTSNIEIIKNWLDTKRSECLVAGGNPQVLSFIKPGPTYFFYLVMPMLVGLGDMGQKKLLLAIPENVSGTLGPYVGKLTNPSSVLKEIKMGATLDDVRDALPEKQNYFLLENTAPFLSLFNSD